MLPSDSAASIRVAPSDVAVAPVPSKPYEVWIIWGDDDSRRAARGDWDKVEGRPACYGFDTKEELTAFWIGVHAGGDDAFEVLTREQVDLCGSPGRTVTS